MSLLNRATDIVTVFPEESFTDADGNDRTRASTVGVVAKAVVQPMSGGGEQQGIGSQTEERLRLRLVGWKGGELGSQSQVQWNGRRYVVHGEPRRHKGSHRTAHVDYVLVRK